MTGFCSHYNCVISKSARLNIIHLKRRLMFIRLVQTFLPNRTRAWSIDRCQVSWFEPALHYVSSEYSYFCFRTGDLKPKKINTVSCRASILKSPTYAETTSAL